MAVMSKDHFLRKPEMIVFLSKDIFFLPLVQKAAHEVGCETTAILSYDSSKLSNVVAGEVSCCLVDLSSIEAAAISVAVESLRTRFPDAKLVAFGPHVQENRLQAAAHAGCDPVLTRGQLNANLAGYLRQWLGSVS